MNSQFRSSGTFATVALLLASVPAAAQSRFAHRGFGLGVSLVTTSSWAWVTDSSSSSPEMRGATPSSAGFAASISYAPVPWAGAWLGAVASFYGESAYTDVAGGVTARLPLGRFLPYGIVGIGSTTTDAAGGFSYGYTSVGAGTEFYLTRRIALDLRFERLLQRGRGEQDQGGASASAEEARNRWHLGTHVHVGPGN